jgi:hypothetical protein
VSCYPIAGWVYSIRSTFGYYVTHPPLSILLVLCNHFYHGVLCNLFISSSALCSHSSINGYYAARHSFVYGYYATQYDLPFGTMQPCRYLCIGTNGTLITYSNQFFLNRGDYVTPPSIPFSSALLLFICWTRFPLSAR